MAAPSDNSTKKPCSTSSRVALQTAPPALEQLPAGMARAAATWYVRNPDYEHVYYSDAALEAYVAAHGHEVRGFSAAYRAALIAQATYDAFWLRRLVTSVRRYRLAARKAAMAA